MVVPSGFMRRALFLWAVAALCWAGRSTQARAQELLTLEEAVAAALRNNYDVRLARNEFEIAANDHSLGNAGFLPQLQLSAGQNNSINNTRQEFLGDQGVIDRKGAQTNRRDAGVDLSWTLFDGLGRFATYERLEQEQTREALTAEGTAEAVVAEVIISYHDLTRQQQQLAVFEEAVAVDRERVRIAELRRDLGSASELDVRQAILDLNADEASRLRQQTALANAKAVFNQLIARSGDLNYVVADTIVVDTTLHVDALAPAVLAENTALQVAEQERVVVGLERREIISEYFPRIAVNVGYGYSNLEAETGFLVSNRSFDFTYGLALSYNLFDGFNRHRRLQNAGIREQNARLRIEDVRSQLEAELASLYNSYRNSLALVALERESLDITRQNVEIALERFRLGTISSVELREVQETRVRAQLRLIIAQYEAKQAEIGLRRLSGQIRVQ